MPRGSTSEIGAERIAPNGYKYRKTNNGWELIHRLIAEESLGRKLYSDEYASFKDNDRTNFDPDNIIVQIRGRTSLKRKLAQVQARIDELQATKEDLLRRLALQEKL